MGVEITVSSKGQMVIPRDVRDALGLVTGGKLMLERVGQRLILEPAAPPRERISYAEFRQRVPAYTGPPVAVGDMAVRDDDTYRDRSDQG